MEREKRKNEHLRYAVHLENSPATSGLEDIQFIPDSLPGLSLEEVDISTQLGEFSLKVPLIINAITGGCEEGKLVNQLLAQIAKNCGLPIAVGSQSIALENSKFKESFEIVRKVNPDGLIFANIGASVPVEQAKAAVEMLEADALQIHLNTAQELAMGEGDRDFRGYEENIASIREKLPVPIIVKEVGFGLSRETVRKLLKIGVKIIDIGGKGGTNFIAIEKARQDITDPIFIDWGIPTTVSLVETLEEMDKSHCLIASGGLNNGLDLAKSLALGAKAGAIAGPFLKTLTLYGDKALTEQMNNLIYQLKITMLLTGASNIPALQTKPLVILGKTKDWLEQRLIDTKKYANR